MPVNLSAVAASFEMVGNLVNKDEEASRIVGIYMDMLRESLNINGVLTILSLGDYVVPCESSYVASALSRVGLRYVRGLKCIEVIRVRMGFKESLIGLTRNW